MKHVITAFLVLVVASQVFAQNNKPAPPNWVKMMADCNANYFQTVKSFDDYWEKRERPVIEEEGGEILLPDGDNVMKKSKLKDIGKRKKEMINDGSAERLSMEYKFFIHWQRESLPYVQPNGHILTLDEREANWNKEMKNRAAANKLNNKN